MWLNKIFKKQENKKLTKIEYFEKFQFFQLFTLLHNAETLIETEIDSKSVFNKFKNEFIEEIYDVEGSNIADLTMIWNWFKPEKEWSLATKEKGETLRKQIFEIVDFWKRNQEFLPGTKLTLNNENGIVLNEETNGIYGKILWDTEKENNIEDWSGLIGSFIDSGGKILNQNFEFKYIKDNKH